MTTSWTAWGARAGLAAGALLALAPSAGRTAFAEDAKPAGGASAAPLPDEDPTLEGDAKKKYDADLDRFAKRYKSIKDRDGLVMFLNELDADGSRAARDWLMQYARTVKSAEYRVKAFESLTKIGGSKSMAFLCGKDGVRSPDSLVQRQAVDALAKSGDARCVTPLLTALSDPALKMETVGAVCITLGKTAPSDEKVIEMLFKEAADRRDTVRASAIEALGYVSTDKAFAFLLETLQHDKNAAARAGAATGLGHAGKQEAIPALQAAASGDKSEPVKAAAIKSLKDLGATGK